MATIPDEARHLFEGRDFAHVATVNPNGSTQVSPVWIALDGDLVVFNTNEGLVKTKNLRNNPDVAISMISHANPYESLLIQGKVVEMTGEGAEEGIDALAKRYLGVDSFPFRRPGDVRVIVKIRPEKVHHRGKEEGVDTMPEHDESAAQLREQTLELHRGHLRNLLDKNMEAWVDAFADDAVFELPFAPPNYPQRLVGKTAIWEYVKDYPKRIDLQGFAEVIEHPTTEPGVLVVEAQVEGRVIATGKPYRVRYVWVVTVEEGKIVKQRDYWNPLAVLEALGARRTCAPPSTSRSNERTTTPPQPADRPGGRSCRLSYEDGLAKTGITWSWTSRNWSRMVATPGSSIPEKALTSAASVMARTRWFTPVDAISVLIFSAHSSGVPATESLSASSGGVSSNARSTRPSPTAAMMSVRSAGSTSLRASCSAGIDDAYRPTIARAASLAARESGPVEKTIQAPRSSESASRPARSAPMRTFSTMYS